MDSFDDRFTARCGRCVMGRGLNAGACQRQQMARPVGEARVASRALTAKELAPTANVAAPTASGHLAKLLAAGLVEVAAQGRHRYYRIGSADVARMLEGLMAVRRGRSRVAVAIADRLCERGLVELSADGGAITPSGAPTRGHNLTMT